MSREPRPFTVLGFASVHDALAAEDVLRASGVSPVTIPSPRDLGELCGIALRLEMEDAAGARHTLEAAGHPPLAVAVIRDI